MIRLPLWCVLLLLSLDGGAVAIGDTDGGTAAVVRQTMAPPSEDQAVLENLDLLESLDEVSDLPLFQELEE